MTDFDVITFDCYGTLIDWETGIREAFVRAAQLDGVTLDPDHVLSAYAEAEPKIQSGAYRSYRDVLRAVAVEVAERLGWLVTPEQARFLPASLPTWKPFADTNPALEALVDAGYRLGILSNIDDDLLRGTLRHFSVPFELVVTAEQVRAYKPAAPHFEAARRRIGESRWLHAAQSYFHDIEPAVRHGVPVVWVNRKGEEPGGTARPDGEVHDLLELVEWVEE